MSIVSDTVLTVSVMSLTVSDTFLTVPVTDSTVCITSAILLSMVCWVSCAICLALFAIVNALAVMSVAFARSSRSVLGLIFLGLPIVLRLFSELNCLGVRLLTH